MAAGVWDGADRLAGLEERLGSPLLRLLLAGSKVAFVVCRSHGGAGIEFEMRVGRNMPHACPEGSL